MIVANQLTGDSPQLTVSEKLRESCRRRGTTEWFVSDRPEAIAAGKATKGRTGEHIGSATPDYVL